MADHETGEDRKLSRLGSFIDGVFAIAITLPVVQLTPPTVGPDRDLAAACRQLIPGLVSYAPGFVVIGAFWNSSHFGAKLLRRGSRMTTALVVDGHMLSVCAGR